MKHTMNWLMLGALLALPTTAFGQSPATTATTATKPSAAPKKVKTVNLREAYQREYSLLLAERTALDRQLKTVQRQTAGMRLNNKAKISGLEQELVGLRAEADRLDEQLSKSEEVDASADKELLGETLRRAHDQLSKLGVKLAPLPKEPKARLAALAVMAKEAARQIERSSELRIRREAFYLRDGRRVTGQVAQLGGVATWGVSPEGSGALAPSGGGTLRMWPEEASATAKAMVQGAPAQTIRLLLTAGVDKAMTPKTKKTPLMIVQRGGTVAWVIVWLGVAGLLLTAVRAVLLWFGGRNRRPIDAVVTAVGQGRVNEALGLCEGKSGAAPRVAAATVSSLTKERGVIEDAAAEALLAEQPLLERFGATITVIAAVAPLLGLLGTVTGMIGTFDVITEHGTGDPKLLSGGISEALITTELGLIVAIPTLLLGTLLNGYANQLQGRLEHVALQLINAAERHAAGSKLDDRVKPNV